MRWILSFHKTEIEDKLESGYGGPIVCGFSETDRERKAQRLAAGDHLKKP
jgi:hypothetical protein